GLVPGEGGREAAATAQAGRRRDALLSLATVVHRGARPPPLPRTRRDGNAPTTERVLPSIVLYHAARGGAIPPPRLSSGDPPCSSSPRCCWRAFRCLPPP